MRRLAVRRCSSAAWPAATNGMINPVTGRSLVIALLSGLVGCLFPRLDGLSDASAPSEASTPDASSDVVEASTDAADAGADVQPPFCAAYADAGGYAFC